MAEDNKTIRAILIARKNDLAEQSRGSADDRRPVELDQQSVGRVSRIDAIQQQEMSAATERRRVAEMQRIDSAIRRLDVGEYGACVRCGEDIDEARLGLDPAVTLCIYCARGR